MVLITGSGFIGSAIAQSFGDSSLTVQRSQPSGRSTLKFDLTNTAQAATLIDELQSRGIRDIIHTAAVTPWADNPNFSLDIAMAKTLTRVCNELKIRSLLFLSGWNVYTMQGAAPFGEGSPVGPSTDYGKSKYEVETYLRQNLQHTKLVNLRLSSVYGPGQTSAGLIPNLVNTAFKGEDISLNSVDTRRDYLYIDDLVAAVQKILKNDDLPDSLTLNIGSGSSVSVLEVGQAVQGAYEKLWGQTISIKTPQNAQESKPIDNRLDITKAQTYGLLQDTKSFTGGILNYMTWKKSL